MSDTVSAIATFTACLRGSLGEPTSYTLDVLVPRSWITGHWQTENALFLYDHYSHVGNGTRPILREAREARGDTC